MHETKLLEQLFDEKIIRILRQFLEEPQKQFYLKELSDYTKTSIASTHRILQRLVNLEIIKEIKISKFRAYQLLQNEKTEFLGSFIKSSVRVLEIFINKVKNIKEVKSITLHGSESEDLASVLIIGVGIDSNEIKAICAELKDKYNYTITYMILTAEQYSQMTLMGLYSSQKKVLFERS